MDFQDYFELTQLYADYASALSSGEWDLWPEFFTEPCFYEIIPRENYDRGLPLAIMRERAAGRTQSRAPFPRLPRRLGSASTTPSFVAGVDFDAALG